MQFSTKLKIIWTIVFTGLVASSLSRNTASTQGSVFDFIFHVSIYSVLSFIPILLFRKRLIAFMVTIAIAPISFLFEMLHGMISGVDFQNLGAFYNNVGILIGIIAAAILRLKKHYENESIV
ncbi:MAG: hypothetical protein WCG19_01655 [Chlorobiaceae bacterium]